MNHLELIKEALERNDDDEAYDLTVTAIDEDDTALEHQRDMAALSLKRHEVSCRTALTAWAMLLTSGMVALLWCI